MAATLDSFFGKKDDLRVPYGRGEKPDSEKSVDLRSEERLMSKSPLPGGNKLKAVKLCTGDGMKDLKNPAPLEMLAMDPENKSIISGVFANSKENKDKASVKVYTRRVGQEVFWDTKLQRHRTLEELEMDPEICNELWDYRLCLAFKESEMETCYSDNLRIKAENCWDSMELEHPATFEELGMDPENKGIISDFFGFVRANELCKRIGQASKKDNCLVYDSPGTGRWSIIAAMANYLKFDIYHLDLTSFSSLKELQYTLLSTSDRSVIAIEGLCQCARMLLKLSDDEYAAKYLMIEINILFSRRDNERIFVFITNHRDQHDAASLRPVGGDIYINTSSPLPTSLPGGGKRTYQNSLLVSKSKKENTREAYDSTKGYPLPNFNATKNKAVKVYSGFRARRWLHSMELERPPTFAELGKDPENEGIISDLLRFVRDKELYKRIGKDWKRGYLLYDSPGADRPSLIAAMANYLKFDIYDLDLTRLSSFDELLDVLVSINNCSLISIKDFDHWFGMHPNIKNEVESLAKENELTLSGLFEIIEGLLNYEMDERIIVLTTNHNHRDRYHIALLSPLNIDAYMHTSSSQPIALPDEGEIVELDSSEQKLLVDFDATNNRAYQSSVLVSNSEKENTRESLKRRCMTENVLSSDDSTTRISLTKFDAPDYRADLVRAYQSSPITFTSENKDTRERLNGECLSNSVLNDDLIKQKLLPEHASLAFTKLTSEDVDGFYDSISVDPDSDSDSDEFDDGARMLPNLKDEVVDGLSSSCGDERMTVSTTNHRDPHDAALLPLVNRDTDIRTASPQPIALPDGGEIVQLESIEQKSLVDFDATNNRANQSGVLAFSEKKYTIDAYKGRWESLIQRTEKDMGEGLNEEYLTKCALILDDSTEQNSVDPRRGRGRLHSTEHEQPATFAELGMDPEIEGIVSDLLRFVREEFYKRVGKAWKRGYLLYNPPCTDRSSLMAYIAKRLEFEIYKLDVTGLSSIEELTNVLVSMRNRSLIVIKDFDHWVGMLPNLKNELTLSGLLEIIHGLLSSCGDERIIILTANQNHIDRDDAALQRPFNIDLYIHTSSPQPIAIPDGGEIVQLDSSEQKPLEDFEATNNRAYQSDVPVSDSGEKSTREASRGQCIPESVHSLVDSTTIISSTDFDGPSNSAHLVRAYHSGPIVFNSEKKDSGEGLNRECLIKSVLSLDYSSRQKQLPDVDSTKNKAHLVRAYQKALVVSLSENKNRGEALKRERITKSILGLEDLQQQHSGGRLDDAAKNFGAIYVLGIHKTDSLAQKSSKVVETLLTREQPNDCVPLLSIGRLTLEGREQEKKSPNLPMVLQINVVEQRVTKLSICLEGLTAESASSSRWPIGLPDGRHVVVLDPLEQSTKSIAHADWGDQCSSTVSLPEKKMVGKTSKEKCRTMSVTFESCQQHFGGRSEGSAKNFRAMRIGRKRGINWLSTVKLIHKQHGIHQWPFRQKWATRKRYSAGDKRSFEVSSLSMNEKLDSSLQFIQMFQCAKADESGPTVSNSEKRSMREASKRDSLKDLRQHFGAKCKDVAKGLCDSLAWKSSKVLDSFSLGRQSYNIRHLARRRTLTHKHCVRLKKSQDLPQSLRRDCSGELAAQAALGLPDGGHIPSLPEKKIMRKTLKRKSRTMSVLSLEDHQQHVGRRWEEDAKFLGAKRICRQLAIDHKPTEKRILRQHGTRRRQFKQSAINLPDGGHILSLSKKKIVRKTLKRKYRNMSVLRSEYHQHVNSKWDDVVKSLGGAHAAQHIYRQLVIHRVSRAKRIRRQHRFHRWPFQQNWATVKGYFLGHERPVDVISLSMDGKLVPRVKLIHISWLGRFSPRPPALPLGGEIVGPPLALSSSQLPSTSNRAQLGGQDRSGSTASHSENERTTEPKPEGRKRKINLTIEDLRPHVLLKCAEAAKKFQISQTTFKRYCRELGIKQWPDLPNGEKVLKPPDPPERNTRQIEMVNEAVHLPEPIEVRKPPDPHERTTRETEIENEVVVHLPEPIEVSRPPDPCERNTRQTEVENVVVHHVHEPNHRRNYFDNLCRSEENDSMDLRSFLQGIEAIQVIEESPLSTAYPNPNSLCRSEENDSMDFQSVLQEIEAIQVREESPLSTAYPSPNLDAPLHPQVVSTQMVSGNTGIPNNQTNLLALQAETHLERRGTRTTCSNPASSQDTRSVMLKVYGLQQIIRFQFPLTSGIDELKGEVAMRLKLQQDSFDMHYEDDEGDKILIPIDKDLTNYLSSSVNPVIKLWVVPSPTDLCGNCGGSLKR